MRIYYFQPDFITEKHPSDYTEQEIVSLMETTNEIECYTPQGFEQAFNDEIISDMGYIRIFQ